jgi:hypothetical protein
MLKKYLAYHMSLAINILMSAEWLNIGTLPDCKTKNLLTQVLWWALPSSTFNNVSPCFYHRLHKKSNSISTLQNGTFKTTRFNTICTSKSKAKSVHGQMFDSYIMQRKSRKKIFNDVKLQQVHSCYLHSAIQYLARLPAHVAWKIS